MDVPLTDRARARAASAWPRGGGDRAGGVEAVYAGTDLGARQTAEYVARSLGLKARASRELRGLGLGLWEGQLVADVRDRHNRLYEQWRRAPCSITPPFAERMEAAFARTGAVLKKLRRRHRGGSVAVVASPVVLALLICRIRGLSPDRVFAVVDRLAPVVRIGEDGATVRQAE